MTSPPSTRGNPIAGGAAALLAATRLRVLLRGDRTAAGSELLLDLERHACESLRLVASPTCRAPHRRPPITPIDDTSIEALAALLVEKAMAGEHLADATPAEHAGRLRAEARLRREAQIASPSHTFVSDVECDACHHTERTWRVLLEHDARVGPCPACGAARQVPGFAQRQRVHLGELPASWQRRSPRDLGLRTGDVLELRLGDVDAHHELAPPGERVVSRATPSGAPSSVAVFGLGNIGSALVPHVARLPGVDRVLVCDPDRYEPGQQIGQVIAAADVGRPKAEVARETLQRIRPELGVDVFAMPLEAVPVGALRGSIVVSALDSIVARLHLADRARRVGAPFVDTGVAGGESLLARVTVYGTAPEDACFECALDHDTAIDGVWPCDAGATSDTAG